MYIVFAEIMARIPIKHRILMCGSSEIESPDDPVAIDFSDTVFELLSQESEPSSLASSIDREEEDEEEDNRNVIDNGDPEDNNDRFWETRHQLLQGIICRTSSLETKIRRFAKEALRGAQLSGNTCACGSAFQIGCRKCLMEELRRCLHNAGYNSAICKSKWKSSRDIPSGEHTFLDVLDNSNPKKEVRVIIELNFRAEFEMARANEEYDKLVKMLPEMFVGKIERLLGLLKILCAAAKKCMKEKKMHLGPWRKHRYMQAKWLRTCERTALSPPPSLGFSGLLAPPAVSTLTADMMNNFTNLHRPVVKVL
ncbi:uncharacterized protein [Henckelia pumila]|uniref:uncharacterized protein n=1 Tax=Henckelia pumila TaxID=405737 RepID=UPI003C6E94C9